MEMEREKNEINVYIHYTHIVNDMIQCYHDHKIPTTGSTSLDSEFRKHFEYISFTVLHNNTYMTLSRYC